MDAGAHALREIGEGVAARGSREWEGGPHHSTGTPAYPDWGPELASGEPTAVATAATTSAMERPLVSMTWSARE